VAMTLLIGGARSGKSALAVRLASASGREVVFLATGQPLDGEMEARIAAHRAARPPTWRTVEAPVELGAALAVVGDDDTVVLDCLTLWVANLLAAGGADDALLERAGAVAAQTARRNGPTIVVSNEVGSGIVPVNELARRYRDLLGAVNATFASAAERSVLVVAGKVLELADAPDLAGSGLHP
jgi:adenosylcobinamide kinase/adenosylcobinamide-phosphate guanylyltransferase